MAEPPIERALAHQEIAALERLLEEKKQALAREGKSVPEREVFQEAFRESYGEAIKQAPASEMPPPSTSPVTLPTPTFQTPAGGASAQGREAELEDLVELAMKKGILTAADAARKTSPWLLDELHDRLQDRYYDQLIELRKLKSL